MRSIVHFCSTFFFNAWFACSKTNDRMPFDFTFGVAPSPSEIARRIESTPVITAGFACRKAIITPKDIQIPQKIFYIYTAF